MKTVWMGYDPREKLAYDVARHSILSRTDRNEVQVLPVNLEDVEVKEIFKRPIERKNGKLWCPISQAPMATEFAISRFCVPFLQKTGWTLFVDCDIVCLEDIRELFKYADDKYAVMCVQHEQVVKEGETKMDGQLQTFYARKNWSSVVLWNCDHPANMELNLHMLNTYPGRDLHAFCWLRPEEIGSLPAEWNSLVGINKFGSRAILHYTLGGPFTEGWKGGPLDDIWNDEKAKL